MLEKKKKKKKENTPQQCHLLDHDHTGTFFFFFNSLRILLLNQKLLWHTATSNRLICQCRKCYRDIVNREDLPEGRAVNYCLSEKSALCLQSLFAVPTDTVSDTDVWSNYQAQ